MFKFIKKNPTYSFLILIASLSFFGAVIYRVYKLNSLGVYVSLLISVSVWLILLKKLAKNRKINREINIPIPKKEKKRLNRFYLFLFFISISVCFYILFTNRTTDAVISPWQVVPAYFFAFYFFSAFWLFKIIKKIKNAEISLFLISLFYFLSFSIALIIYKIGYGFDPFIHQATEGLIKSKGQVDPKPFYYLGQYSLVIIISKITSVSVSGLDKILTPLLASLFLPPIIYRSLKNWLSDEKTILLSIVFLLALPFSFFIVSTPQNLSYLFLILLVFLSLNIKNKTELAVVCLFAGTIALIHPITGIPAVFFVSAVSLYHADFERGKKIIFSIIFVISCLILPSAFYFLNQKTAAADSESVLPAVSEQSLNWPYGDNAILNAVYLYGFNFEIFFIGILLFGLFIFAKNKKNCSILKIYLLVAGSLFISFLFIQKMPFDFLISYERDDYSGRVLKTGIIFLLPLVFLAFYKFFEKMREKSKMTKFIFLSASSALMTASLFLSYPRFDNYFNSRGYSTSQADIEAVEFIEKKANDEYIVLANQQVSAGALYRLGFDNHLKNGQIYFYPIPTGGELYKYYLKMVYEKPTRETMIEAMDFAEVEQSFFVLNKYWWASEKILEEAKLEADGYEKLGSGDVWVFWYNK